MADKLTLDKHDMNDRATAYLRIYVGGLTDDACVDSLYNHFIVYGQIDGIILNRVFGFVQFHHESSAQEAIAKGNLSVYQGRKIIVKPTQQNSFMKRDVEVVSIQSEIPPALALSENVPIVTDVDETEDLYDSYGNYVGDTTVAVHKEEEYDEGYSNKSWNERESRALVRGRPIRARGRGRGGPGAFLDRVSSGFSERSPGGFTDRVSTPTRGSDWTDRKYERYSQPEYPRALPVQERNDCEIIVVSKSLTEYAEYIESRLKRLGIVVDLLFPMEDVPIGKVLGNIASRGCLYAILVTAQNQENRSLTLTILHGLPQEHRNMPLEDSLQLLSRNFQEVQRGGPSGREAVYALLGQLADGRTLTLMQYDKVMEYIQERREQQVKIELGESSTTAAGSKTQVDLQQRILNILNDKKPLAKPESPAPAPSPVPVQPVLNKQEQQNKLLSDPTVRKALDSILMKFI